MRSYLVLLIITFRGEPAIAIDCDKDFEQNSYYTSLTEKGKSLESHTTQDQNGYGSCYGNATSTVILGATQLDVSYHQIALSTQLEYPNAKNPNQTKIRDGKNGPYEGILEAGGTGCDALAAIQKQDKICKKESSPVEYYNDSMKSKLKISEIISDLYDEGSIEKLRKIPPEERTKLIQLIRKKNRFHNRVSEKIKCFKKITKYFHSSSQQSPLSTKHESYTVESNLEGIIVDNFASLLYPKVPIEKIEENIKGIFSLITPPLTIQTKEKERIFKTPNDLLHLYKTSPKKFRKLYKYAEPQFTLNQSVTKTLYRHIANEYNSLYKSKNIVTETLSTFNPQDSYRNPNAKFENVINAIDNDPTLQHLKKRKKTVSESLLITYDSDLKDSIHNVIPGECYQKYIPSDLTSGEECNSDIVSGFQELNDLLNWFNRLEKEGEWYNRANKTNFNPGNVAYILENVDKNFIDLYLGLIAPLCNKEKYHLSDKEKEKIKALSCHHSYKELKMEKAIKYYILNANRDVFLKNYCPTLDSTAKKECIEKLSSQNFDKDYLKKKKDELIYSYTATNCVLGCFWSGKTNETIDLINKLYDNDPDTKIKNKALSLEWQARFTDALITRKRPIYLSVCGEALSALDRKDPPPNCTESNHAVVLSGMRCRGKKQEYQIINSWGTGPKWVDADYLFRYTYRTDVIK